MAVSWGDELKATRGDLLKVKHTGRSAVYVFKASSHLTADTIALDYDQKRQLGLVGISMPVEISVKKAGRSGTFAYLWKHVDPAIRLPFKISIWLTAIGTLVGCLIGYSMEHLAR